MREKPPQGGGSGGAREAAGRRLPDSVDPCVLNSHLVEGSIDRCCDHLVVGARRLVVGQLDRALIHGRGDRLLLL